MKLINLKCPECNAPLKVDPNREFIYCEYCGAKILLDKEEKVSRTIDEAEVRKAEAEEKIRIEEIKAKSNEKKIDMIEMFAPIVIILLLPFLLIILNHLL